MARRGSDGSRPLAGKVAVVAGATRGAGRGTARMLAEAGAKVYCTGRSIDGDVATEGRTETIDGTVRLIEAAHGVAEAVQVDHTDEGQVLALVDRVRRDEGRLDVLVNSVWGGDAITDWGARFWELDIADGERMLRQAILSHLITNRHAAPLMVEAGSGLIVEMTDGDGFYYRGNLFYDLVKTSVIRLAFAMSEELRGTGVTAVAVTPGFMRSEAVLDHFGVTEQTWQDGIEQDRHFAASETPCFVGRAVAALAADASVSEHAGRVLASWTLARTYGFTDVDGRAPDWGQHFEGAFKGAYRPLDETFYAYWSGFEAMQAMLDDG